MRVLLTKIERLEYNLLDDIALGHYIDRYFPNTRMVCLSEHLIDVKENNLSALNYTQIMFYRHKTACRQHDVAHIKHIIRMLSLGEYKEHSPLLRIKLLSLSQLDAVQPEIKERFMLVLHDMIKIPIGRRVSGMSPEYWCTIKKIPTIHTMFP